MLLQKDREISDLNQANKDMHHELAQHRERIRKLETEKRLLLHDIGHLNEEIDAKSNALKKLNDDLVKAQKTIKVQSDQISGVKDISKLHTTPQRLGPPADAFSQVYSQPPPAYNVSGGRLPHARPMLPNQANPVPALRRQISSYTTSQQQATIGAPSIQRRASATPASSYHPLSNQQGMLATQHAEHGLSHRPSVIQGMLATQHAEHGLSHRPSVTQGMLATQHAEHGLSHRPSMTPLPAYDPFQSQQGVLVTQGTDQASGINLIAEFTPFFHFTETWAHNYASLPDQHKDLFISNDLRDRFAIATDPRTAMKLLSSSKTRPLLVARIINQIIVDFAFRPLLLRGFSPSYDSKISSFRGQLMGNIPSNVRRALLLACAETVVDMTQANGFEDWMEAHITPKVHDMWHLLRPLFAHGTPNDPAWNDLNHIWKEATRIGVLMLSKPCIYSLDFPPMGPNSYFNPSSMCSRDEDFTQNPAALGSMAVSVRLAITPIVTETDFMKNTIEAKCLHQAMVLLAF